MAENSSHPVRILVVDDDSAISRSIKIVLEQRGLLVDTSRTGQDALRLLAQTDQTIDLMLVDVKLPDMTGDELAREVHQHDQQVPIVLCSGMVSVARSEWKQMGVRAFLQKPYSVTDVLDLIEDLLGTL